MRSARNGDQGAGTERSGPRKSRLATVALLLPCVGLPAVFLIAGIWMRLTELRLTDGRPWFPAPEYVGLVWTALLLSLAGLTLGIVSLGQTLVRPARFSREVPAIPAIVASVFAGLLCLLELPVAETAQGCDHANVCLSNVKALTKAMQFYLEDNNGIFPDTRDWCDRIASYVGDKTAFICPDARRLRSGYAFNSRLSGVAADSITNPDTTVLLFESGRGWNAAGGAELLPAKPRHGASDTWSFVSGHVQKVPRAQRRESYGVIIQWQPQPEPK